MIDFKVLRGISSVWAAHFRRISLRSARLHTITIRKFIVCTCTTHTHTQTHITTNDHTTLLPISIYYKFVPISNWTRDIVYVLSYATNFIVCRLGVENTSCQMNYECGHVIMSSLVRIVCRKGGL